MGIISRMIAPEKRYLSLSDLDKYIEYGYYGESNTAAGLNVNEVTALQSVAVYACVRILAETIASLPLQVYERQAQGRRIAADHALNSVLHKRPNPEMSSYKFRETLQGHLCTWGNAYAEIEWNMRNGTVKNLWPLRPDRMEVTRKNGQLWYVYRLPTGERVGLPSKRVLHIKGFGFNGLTGYSPIGMARQAIALGMATEKYGTKFFGNDARPGGVIKRPDSMSNEAKDNFNKHWAKAHQGLNNAHRVAILDEGMEWQNVGFPNDDIQFLQTCERQDIVVARLYRIPLHLLQLHEKSTAWGSGIAQLGQGFITYTILPWTENWEQEIDLKLLLPKDQDRYYTEHNMEYYLRGDYKDRAEYYNKMFQVGGITINKILQKENENTIGPLGDYHFVPLNYLPVEMLAQTMEGGEEGEEAARKLRRLVTAMTPEKAEARQVEKIPDDPRMEPEIKTRTKRQTVRHSLAASFKPMLSDAALRVIRGERRNIMKEAKKQLRNTTNFELWLEEYFRDKHPQFVRAQMSPVFTTLATAIQAAAAEEIEKEPEMSAEHDRFVSEYGDTFTARFIRSSKGRIKNTVDKATEEERDPVEALDEMYDQQEETRPGIVSMRESVQLANSIAALTFGLAGYRLMWGAVGESCPYCQEIDGKIISYGGAFLDKGASLQPEGTEKPLITSSRIGNPPAHPGCDCTLFPA